MRKTSVLPRKHVQPRKVTLSLATAPAGLQGTVGMFYKHVSFADTTRACTLFLRDDTRQKFANGVGASDCADVTPFSATMRSSVASQWW